MIDFPIIVEETPKFAWVLSGIMYFIILVIYNKWAFTRTNLHSRNSSKPFFAIWVFVYCLTAIYCGDWTHLQTIVKESVGMEYIEGKGIEQIYHILANTLNGNYLIFRTIVWGTGLFAMIMSFRLSNLEPYHCLFFLFGIYITAFAYTRAGVALSIFYLGFVLLFQTKKNRKTITFILGIALIVSSAFLHRSIIVLIVLIPLSIKHFNRRTSLLLSFGFILVFLVLWRSIFEGFMSFLLSSDEYAYRVELYEGASGSQSFSFGLNGFFFLWYKAVVHVPFWFCVITLYEKINKGLVPSNIQAIFRFSILLYIFFIMMLMMYGSKSAFYYRYEGMLYIPITIMINYLFQNGGIEIRKYSLVFWICALSQCKDFIYRLFFW